MNCASVVTLKWIVQLCSMQDWAQWQKDNATLQREAEPTGVGHTHRLGCKQMWL